MDQHFETTNGTQSRNLSNMNLDSERANFGNGSEMSSSTSGVTTTTTTLSSSQSSSSQHYSGDGTNNNNNNNNNAGSNNNNTMDFSMMTGVATSCSSYGGNLNSVPLYQFSNTILPTPNTHDSSASCTSSCGSSSSASSCSSSSSASSTCQNINNMNPNYDMMSMNMNMSQTQQLPPQQQQQQQPTQCNFLQPTMNVGFLNGPYLTSIPCEQFEYSDFDFGTDPNNNNNNNNGSMKFNDAAPSMSNDGNCDNNQNNNNDTMANAPTDHLMLHCGTGCEEIQRQAQESLSLININGNSGHQQQSQSQYLLPPGLSGLAAFTPADLHSFYTFTPPQPQQIPLHQHPHQHQHQIPIPFHIQHQQQQLNLPQCHHLQPHLQQQSNIPQLCFNAHAMVPSSIISDASETMYIEQIQRFPRLPLDAHRKIRTMGNEIIHYFEARLIHVESPAQVNTFDSHTVFLKSPSTAQHWVMAFVKENQRVSVKFNRLLTVHVKVTMQNPLTIDIEPSKSPNRRSDEQFIFNFENQRVCAEFLRVLNILKKEVWTRRGETTARQQSPMPTGRERSISLMTGRSGVKCDGDGMTTNQDQNQSSNNNEDGEISPRKKFKIESPMKNLHLVESSPRSNARSLNHLHLLSSGNGMEMNQSGSKRFFFKSSDDFSSTTAGASPKFMRFPYRMKFILKNTAILSLRKDKNSDEYANLGMGTLKIWGNDDCFNQLDFISKCTGETVCSHPIYSWNNLTMTANEEMGEYICKWTAAADILNAPTNLPVVREFKMRFPSFGIASSFKTAFDESCEKASRPEIIFKSHQNGPIDQCTSTLLP